MKSLFRRSRASSRDALLAMAGAALGAALMYFLHPATRRRAVAQPTDDTLAERVRAALGRVVEDPGAIDVRVRDGLVILRGPAIAEQAGELVACAERVPGVRAVENRMAVNPGNGAAS
jgi:osmotically-inducible protein OsmY